MNLRRLSLLLSACLLSAAGATSAFAQRPYQQRWMEFYKTLEEPIIIEDDAEPLSPEEETFLGPDRYSPIGAATVFPGRASAEPEPAVTEGFRGYARGALSTMDNNPPAALRGYELALKANPKSTWLRLRTATAAVRANDLKRAEELLKQVIDEEPENAQAVQQMAELRLAQNNLAAARDLLTRVNELQPQRIDALRLLTYIAYEIDKDYEETKRLAQKILYIDDRHIEAILWNAEASALTGDVRHAARLYKDLLSSRPNLVAHLADVARRLASQGDLDSARILYETALLANGADSPFFFAWERILQLTGGQAAIEEGYKRLIEESFHDLAMYDLYANHLTRQERWDDLVALRKEALAREPNHINSLLDIATHYLRSDDFENAESYLARAADANPDDHDVFRRIAETYIDYGRLDEARELLTKAHILSPNNADTLRAMSLLEEQSGDNEKAIEHLREAIRNSPASNQLLKQMAGLHYRAGKLREAREYYQQATAADPTDAEAWTALALIAYEEEDMSAIEMMETQVRRVLRDSHEVQASLGLIAENNGDFERAIRYYRNAITLQSNDVLSRFALAKILYAFEKKQEAEDLITRGVPAANTPAPLRDIYDSLRADFYMQTNQFEKARELMQPLLTKAPKDFRLHYSYQRALVRLGLDKESEEALSKVVRDLGAEMPSEVQRLRAQVYQLRGDTPRAITLFKRLAEENEDSPEALMDLALAVSEADDLISAEEIYTRLMEMAPKDENPYYETAANNLAYLFAQNGTRLDDAEKLADEAHAINPGAPYILDTLGWIYFKQERYEEAQKMLEKAANRSLLDTEIFTNLGQLYEKIGEEALAREMYDRALAVDPRDKTATERRRALITAESPSPVTP